MDTVTYFTTVTWNEKYFFSKKIMIQSQFFWFADVQNWNMSVNGNWNETIIHIFKYFQCLMKIHVHVPGTFAVLGEPRHSPR